MSEVSLAVILDILSRGSALAAAALVVWMLVTERLVPYGRLKAVDDRLEQTRADCEARVTAMLVEHAKDEDEWRREKAWLVKDRDELRRIVEIRGGGYRHRVEDGDQ